MAHAKRSKRPRRNLRSVYLRGGTAGYESGYGHGYHLGRCRNVLGTKPAQSEEKRNVRILYVAEGTPGFTTIDLGIGRALAALASETEVVRPEEDAEARADSFRPDLVLVLNGTSPVRMDQLRRIREKGFRTAVWLMDDPYFTDITANFVSLYDYIFTHETNTVEFYRGLGCANSYYLPAAVCFETVSPQFVEMKYRSDVCFVGSAFPNRIDFFNRITGRLLSRGIRLFMAGYGWNQLRDWNRLKDGIDLHGVLYPHSVKHYAGAKIAINLHRSSQERYNSRRFEALSLNPRTFDIAASGTMQLTDIRQQLPHFYQVGVEIDTFDSPEMLADKIDFYLGNEAARRQLALNGLYATVHKHTYVHRLKQLLQLIFG